MSERAAARRAGKNSVVIALLGLALGVLGGCGLFDPASPQPPGSGQVIPLPDLTQSPDSALASLKLGVENRSRDLYVHGIAESTAAGVPDFHAIFDFQDSSDFSRDTGTPAPTDWRSQDEKTFFNVLEARPLAYVMSLSPDASRPDSRGPSLTFLYRRYRIYSGGAPLAFGIADLEIRRVGVNGEWKIVIWTDHRDSETDSTSVPSMGKQRLSSIFH